MSYRVQNGPIMELGGCAGFLFSADKEQVEDSGHKLCVKVPFLNAMKG